jgi:hypothetical protein
VVVDGDVVHRPAQFWTPTVHALLRHLRAAGLRVPEPLGLDAGRERLRFVPGDSGAACWPHQVDDDGLRSAARLLRAVHEATRGWCPPPDARWAAPPRPGPHEVVCHGDPGPWNMVWRNGTAVALLDWDLAYPGSALEDVAYALRWFAPCRSDAEAVRWHGFPEPPDRRHRITVFAQAYGLGSTDGLVDAVLTRPRQTLEQARHLADLGVEPQRTWVAAGHLDDLRAELQWTRDHRHLLEVRGTPDAGAGTQRSGPVSSTPGESEQDAVLLPVALPR